MAFSTPTPTSDCPICLEELSLSEEIFSLPCQRCNFNYCTACVAGFVRSSHDDYQEASDGSRQVKIYIACPQCRSKYPMDISKVLLLRKVHALGINAFSSEGEPLDDQDLKATELANKRDLLSRKKKRQVELAHGLYLKAMEGRLDFVKMEEAESICQRPFQSLPQSTGDSVDEEDADDEYVDDPSSTRHRGLQVDSTLFQGLHDFLGEDEKMFLTSLFTGGEVPKLMQAAMILNGVLKLSMQPPSQRPRNVGENRDRLNYKKLAELMDKIKKSYPLAMHMPGYFILPSFTSSQQYLTFQDQLWDGSITPPAQSKRSFGQIYGENYHPPNADKPRPVVTIQGVRGPAGRVGLRRGDIVTHVNEVEWTGNAKELLEHIHNIHSYHNEANISLTVNATPEVGKFLQVRKALMERANIEHV